MKKEEKNKNKKKDSEPVISPLTSSVLNKIEFPPSNTDPQGWYTGISLDTDSRPEQDADDL